MSMPGREISTGEIVDDALRSGKEVFIPFIYKTPTDESHKVRKEVMDMLQLRSLEDRNSLKADKWGIPSIGSDTVDGRLNCFGGMGVTDGAMPEDRGDSLDVIVMPGLAFDLDLSRLGHGKAYYDTFLERCCYGGRKKPFLGISFAFPSLYSFAGKLTILQLDWLSPSRSSLWDNAYRPSPGIGLSMPSLSVMAVY